MYCLKKYYYNMHTEEQVLCVGRSEEVLKKHFEGIAHSPWWERNGHKELVLTEEEHERLMDFDIAHVALEPIQEVV